VAALIKEELGVGSELIEGQRGEFTVWVGEKLVAEKRARSFPEDADVVAAVRAALDP
jgi:hypothetical protein